MSEIKSIGVLTSGGDAPGMNAAIRAVVRTGIYYGIKMFGIRKGYNGLISGDIFEMNARSVSDIVHRGGTILQTARCKEFTTDEGMQKAMSLSRAFGLDALVVIGGDGSYRGARDFSKYGMKVMGLPGTIDNDIASTEYTIGYDTAMNTVQDALDKIRDTAYSHERCSVLEVMGRHAGHIALNVGVAGGAEVILLPEKQFDFDKDIIRRIVQGRNNGKKNYIIILAEGVAEKIGGALELAKKVEDLTGIETRGTVLGYIQRGGSPSIRDRVMASAMGVKAVELLKDGVYNRVMCVEKAKIVDIDIDEALSMTKDIDHEMLRLVEILSI
ncbi:6-phosphofructokinase [Ruminiclostridium herbifermentans]|uniref:ATP-dependent 6-phosphofructokinase n=1 Tax=Ruminiclostridium herbifermentans TaxID=2488810 RepID=A0A4U7JBT9_9FIRM|nr:6-phosphofructokinase [Ruminiclostridium herbifermentans]QNU67977.1 6-phosphofructokinase [Ruminiclostridium herbifermentans]